MISGGTSTATGAGIGNAATFPPQWRTGDTIVAGDVGYAAGWSVIDHSRGREVAA